ncbi:uncharacterized protein BCR38DRAFT_377222 [Pseudomassariella vexata]|uniref:Annexin n=1 Tax=Pseudomassariella vexata TaxID=1141098 RepID=A0A1Y2DGZ7_9PEZI|nr:uncharacterized protein BCR38DRAFT_377222 [Pseudomassariella vexata]ORY58529.1 hypothetical protein BCR38DRAFT_377222 [Pseudomassariella vexata]
MPGYGAPPTPASLGYDVRQKETYGYPVNVESDAVAIRKAMKGMGCDEAVLVKVLTQPKYSNPWVMQQLIANYNERFVRDLVKDIESETRGDLETALMALVRGPLAADVHLLSKALDRAGTDEDALMNVLLCRSNADIAAIIAEYKRIKGRDLLTEIKDDVDDTLFRLYSMVLSATKAEDSVPPSPPDTDLKVTELHRATEGVIGANAVMVAQIFTSSNSAQIRDISYAYQRKYHRSLRDVIEKEFRGDMEDALLYMLEVGEDQGRADASRLGEPLRKTIRKDSLLINRVLRLFYAPLEVDPRDGVPRPLRLERAKAAYKLKYKVSLKSDIKAFLKGDYEDLILALLREM